MTDFTINVGEAAVTKSIALTNYVANNTGAPLICGPQVNVFTPALGTGSLSHVTISGNVLSGVTSDMNDIGTIAV